MNGENEGKATKTKQVQTRPKRRGKKAKKTRAPYTAPSKQLRIHVMRLEGKSVREIARVLRMGRVTVKKFVDTPSQRAELAEMQGKVVGVLSDAVDRIQVEIADPMSQSGPVLAMKALENCEIFPKFSQMPAPPEQPKEGEMSQFDRDVQNFMQRMVACMLHKNRVYGLPDQEVLKEPETRYLELAPAAVNVPVNR